MNALNISSFIWGIADDVLRDHYVRGKYRDVILPMTVIRRLDAVLEPTKEAVLSMKTWLDKDGITNQESALRRESGEAFYNTSPFRLRDLRSIGKQQQLRANFDAYLDGFSPNVQEILEGFRFRNEIPKLVDEDILGFLLGKFLDSSVNLSPRPVLNADGSTRLPGIDPGRAYKASEIKKMRETVAPASDAPPVIRKLHRSGVESDPLQGLFPHCVDGKQVVVEYEPDKDLRDTEQVPLLEEGGIESFLRREVLPYAPDAWYTQEKARSRKVLELKPFLGVSLKRSSKVKVLFPSWDSGMSWVLAVSGSAG